MKTSFKKKLSLAILLIGMLFSSFSLNAENMYVKIFPKLSEHPDIEMRYLGTEAYETAMGMQLVSFQTRALAEKCMGGITSLTTITTESGSGAEKLGLKEFEAFKKSHPELKLLSRKKNNEENRSIWLLPGNGNEAPQMIVIVQTPSYALFSVLTGKSMDSKNYKNNSQVTPSFNLREFGFLTSETLFKKV